MVTAVKGGAREKVFACQECGATYANPRNTCAKCGGNDLDVVVPAPVRWTIRRGSDGDQLGVYGSKAAALAALRGKSQKGVLNGADTYEVVEYVATDTADPETQAIADEADATVEESYDRNDDTPVQSADEVAAEDAAHAERNAAVAAAVNAKLDATAAAMETVLAGGADTSPDRCPKCTELTGFNREQQACYACGFGCPEGTVLVAPVEGNDTSVAPPRRARAARTRSADANGRTLSGRSAPARQPVSTDGKCPVCHDRPATKGKSPCHKCWLQAKVDRGAPLVEAQRKEAVKWGMIPATTAAQEDA